MDRSFGLFAAGSLCVLIGCSSPAQARQCPASPADPGASAAPREPDPAPAATSAQPAGETTVGVADANATPVTSGAGSLPEALPELKVKLTGMHIGGGPNDAETKRPFIAGIEAGFDQMRACYQKADEPAKGGTFGVDLRIEREGGHPKLQAVRTAMKGDALRACLEQAFAGLEFLKPVKGATVLSASVYFELTP